MFKFQELKKFIGLFMDYKNGDMADKGDDANPDDRQYTSIKTSINTIDKMNNIMLHVMMSHLKIKLGEQTYSSKTAIYKYESLPNSNNYKKNSLLENTFWSKDERQCSRFVEIDKENSMLYFSYMRIVQYKNNQIDKTFLCAARYDLDMTFEAKRNKKEKLHVGKYLACLLLAVLVALACIFLYHLISAIISAKYFAISHHIVSLDELVLVIFKAAVTNTVNFITNIIPLFFKSGLASLALLFNSHDTGIKAVQNFGAGLGISSLLLIAIVFTLVKLIPNIGKEFMHSKGAYNPTPKFLKWLNKCLNKIHNNIGKNILKSLLGLILMPVIILMYAPIVLACAVIRSIVEIGRNTRLC